MPANILIVDDDRTLLRFVGEYLREEGYQVVSADRGPKALRAFFESRPDLVFLDVMMPGMDGWEVCARMRELADTPIIMLTAKTAEQDKLRGFRLGVDDYITKPFSLAELGARARAILSRTSNDRDQDPPVHQMGNLIVDMGRREARLAGEVMDLTPTEFRLLACLARRPGEAISQEQLIRDVWGDNRKTSASALRRYIWFLRQKIEKDPRQPARLVNVRGYGYRIEA
ncbi:MAG TPA: response regulator transcription factor [Anaerolineales bacterium]